MVILIYQKYGGADPPVPQAISLFVDSDYQDDMNYRYHVNGLCKKML